MRDVAVVIPALNEAESIGFVVGELKRYGVETIIVADGGSTDDTRALAQREGARVCDAGKGYGRACLQGAEAANARVIVFMDGDGADDPALLESLLEPVASGAVDFAIGSRWRGKREPGAMLWHQMFAGLVIGLAIGVLHGVRYTDMCAFRAIRLETLRSLSMREMTYGWNLEMQFRVAKAGLRVLEIPVPCRRRFGGTSHVSGSLSGSLKAARSILATFYRLVTAKEALPG